MTLPKANSEVFQYWLWVNFFKEPKIHKNLQNLSLVRLSWVVQVMAQGVVPPHDCLG